MNPRRVGNFALLLNLVLACKQSFEEKTWEPNLMQLHGSESVSLGDLSELKVSLDLEKYTQNCIKCVCATLCMYILKVSRMISSHCYYTSHFLVHNVHTHTHTHTHTQRR